MHIAFTGCSDDPTDSPPPVSQAKEIVAFGFRAAKNPGLTADGSAVIMGNSISGSVPFGTDVSALVATFSTTGTSVTSPGRPGRKPSPRRRPRSIRHRASARWSTKLGEIDDPGRLEAPGTVGFRRQINGDMQRARASPPTLGRPRSGHPRTEMAALHTSCPGPHEGSRPTRPRLPAWRSSGISGDRHLP
jgi:hypothetical protein